MCSSRLDWTTKLFFQFILRILHTISVCVIFVMMIVGLIGLPSIITSSSYHTSNNFYQPVFAQPSSSSSAPTTAAAAQANRPNILMIIGDDFGWSDIGAFGSQISTPNLDALAKESKILMNYHTIPICSPARDSLITGVDHHIGGIGTMYELIAQNQKGKPGYETWINNRVVTVAELLRDAGYHTYLVNGT